MYLILDWFKLLQPFVFKKQQTDRINFSVWKTQNTKCTHFCGTDGKGVLTFSQNKNGTKTISEIYPFLLPLLSKAGKLTYSVRAKETDKTVSAL